MACVVSVREEAVWRGMLLYRDRDIDIAGYRITRARMAMRRTLGSLRCEQQEPRHREDGFEAGQI